MKNNILMLGVLTLLIFSTLVPISFGGNINNFKEQLAIEDYNRHIYPEFYDVYSVDEIPENIRPYMSDNGEVVQDISNSEVIDYEETPKSLESPPMDSAWPMYCHDTRHTGRSPYSTADNPYFEIWQYRLDGTSYHCAPIIDNEGIIYVGRGGGLYAIYPNGTLKWKYDYPHHAETAPAIDENGIIYVGTVWAQPNYLYAIHSSNGTLKWKYKTGNHIEGSPAIGEDGTIYISDWNGDIHAIYQNGTLKWKYHTGDVCTSSPAIGLDGTIICGSHDNNVYALYPNNGTVKWKFNTGNWVHSSATIADDGTVYIGSDNRKLYALYPNNGTVKWSCSIGSIWGSPTLDENGIIYVGVFQQKFYAVYPNGTIKWKYDAPGVIWFGASAAISADGTIYFGTTWMDIGEGAFIALNSADGTERFKITNSGLFETSPAIGSDGTIYACSSDDEGLLHAFGSLDNYPPDAPTITGPMNGPPGEHITFVFNAVDPDGDDVRFLIDWGDGSSDTTSFVHSSYDLAAEHMWDDRDTFQIVVRAEDTFGNIGPESTQQIPILRNKATSNVLLLRFLEQFPILERLLTLLMKY